MDFFLQIKNIDQAVHLFNDWIAEDKDFNGNLDEYDKQSNFERAIWLLQEVAEHKKIQYKGYFRTKYEKNSEFQRILGKTDFVEQTAKRELYVFMASQDDEEIFNLLKYVYSVTQPTKLDRTKLSVMIDALKSKGYVFERY